MEKIKGTHYQLPCRQLLDSSTNGDYGVFPRECVKHVYKNRLETHVCLKWSSPYMVHCLVRHLECQIC